MNRSLTGTARAGIDSNNSRFTFRKSQWLSSAKRLENLRPRQGEVVCDAHEETRAEREVDKSFCRRKRESEGGCQDRFVKEVLKMLRPKPWLLGENSSSCAKENDKGRKRKHVG